MMLQIQHRESHDVDIFLNDAQLLSYLDPTKHDFEFEVMPSSYEGDGTHSLKIAFEKIGEIDFIVAPTLTEQPTISHQVEATTILLETIPEIVAKKVFFRGQSITPRDIFDIAAAGSTHGDAIIRTLKQYPSEVATTLSVLMKMNPEFVRAAITELMILQGFEHLSESALDQTQVILRSAI